MRIPFLAMAMGAMAFFGASAAVASDPCGPPGLSSPDINQSVDIYSENTSNVDLIMFSDISGADAIDAEVVAADNVATDDQITELGDPQQILFNFGAGSTPAIILTDQGFALDPPAGDGILVLDGDSVSTDRGAQEVAATCSSTVETHLTKPGNVNTLS